MRNVHYIEERWVLEVTFDSIEDQKADQYVSNPTPGVDEAWSFVRHAVNECGGVSWEIREFIKWEKGSRTVTVTSDVIEFLADLQHWLVMMTIPVKVELRRSQGRTT